VNGTATVTVDTVPATMPRMRASTKSARELPPRTSSAVSTSSVEAPVLTVRGRVCRTASPATSAK
jgi:hypothetical protein